ncbi:MAG: gluconolactonase [Candidatus Dactylopiibacterium carminicum]|nr:MAG: gluconolactonase [Candidatus Dactylopiibacterium carminicum]
MTSVLEVRHEALLGIPLRNACGEGPVWHAEQGCWYWIDLPARSIHRLDPASGVLRQWSVDEHLGCMVLRADGGLTCSCVFGIFDVDLPEEGGQALQRRLASVTHAQPGMRFNDGRCDRQGRLWVSSMVMDISLASPAGNWYCYKRADGLQCMEGGYVIPNGSAFSPDGKTFYSSDTHRNVRMVWAWDYDIAEGRAHSRRVFVDMRDMRDMVRRPDGAAVDTEGCYWICCLDEGCIKRFTPGGVLDQVWKTPMLKPTMCAFGGEDMRTLMVTSLSRGPEDLAGDPEGGRLLMFRPGAQGIAEPRLAG